MDGIAYSFSPSNGEYLGPVIAQESPRQAGKLLRPRNASFVAPPKIAERECAVFALGATVEYDSLADNGGTWSVVIDWRRVVLYSTANGTPVSIERFNVRPDPALMTELPRPSNRHTWANDGWVLNQELVAAAVKAERNLRMQEVRQSMASLQDAVDIGEETIAEAALLMECKQYAVALSRIELQSGFPFDVVWPPAPA